MAKTARARLGLIAALCLTLIAAGFLIARPKLLDERVIRISLVDALSEWTGGQVTLRGPAHIQYFPRLLVKTGAFHLSGISRLPSIRQIQAEHAQVRLGLWSLISGAPVVNRVTLVQPMVEATVKPLDGPPRPAGGNQPYVAAITSSPFSQFHIEQGTIKVTGPNSTEMFEEVYAKLELEPSGAHFARGSLQWRKQQLTFNMSGGAPETSEEITRIPLSLNLTGDLLKADIDGQALLGQDVRADGDLLLRISKVGDFARWTGVLVPEDDEERTFEADGSFHWTGHRIGFDEGTFFLDGNKALGALALEFGGTRPKIEGTLALQRLDVTPYLTVNEPKAKKPAPADVSKQVEPSIDLDFPVLHHINFDLRISTTDLQADELSFGQSALALTLDAGKLAADLAVFDFCGGTANSRLELDATVPESALKVTGAISSIALRPCIETFQLTSPVDGLAEASVDVTSSGRNAAELIDNLRGKTTVSVSAGSVDVNFADLLAKTEKGPAVGWETLEEGTTAFTLLRATVFLRHRSIYSDSLEADLGGGTVAGEATVDFDKKALDVQVSYSEKQPSEPPAAEGSTDKVTEPVPKRRIAIKGPWSRPTFSAGEKKSATTSPALPSTVRTGWQRN